MKKLVLLIFGILVVGLVVAVQQGNQGQGAQGNQSGNEAGNASETGNGNQSQIPVQNQTQEQVRNRTQERAMNKTRIREKGNMTFVPWQKRNESECLEGCRCQGAVMSCPTETGKEITIQAGRSGNVIVITIDKTNASTELELEMENNTEDRRNQTRLRVRLSNGRKAEIKVMPDTASERALERLRLKVCSEDRNCTIVLKEAGKENATQLAYELQAERHMRILGIFKAKTRVRAEVNAENGELVSVKKPWWAFLATEPEE